MQWLRTADGLRAVDDAGAGVVVGSEGWTSCGSGIDLPRRVDARIAGDADSLSIPGGPATVDCADECGMEPLRPAETRELDAGEHHLRVDSAVELHVALRGPATVAWPPADRLSVSFPERSPVALGFRSRSSTPTDTVSVPPTPAGLAAAVTRMGHAPRSDGVDRSSPAARPHPPRLTFREGSTVPDVPPAAGDARIAVPDDLGSVLWTAPLAYYLGAAVAVERGATPTLRVPGADADRELAGPGDAADLLERAFWLDCLVREATAGDAAAAARLAALGLDPADVADRSPAGRLVRYLDAPYERIEDTLPTWHLAAYVEPTADRARALPFLLDRLSLLYPPESTDLGATELMERSLDDFYRGTVRRADLVEASLRDAERHCWLAPETPIDVFHADVAAFENRGTYRSRDRETVSVTVVLNDPEMSAERTDAAAAYRASDLPIDLSVRERLTRADLAAVLGEGADLVHYIGHCEEGGLRCVDGVLPAADLDRCRAETFFLNACGSYREGLELVRRGSVAGAVTFREVLDEQATTVGTTFARLLVHGFSVDRALDLARRRVVMGKDYAVVGDGTHSLTRTGEPTLIRAERTATGYAVTCESPPSDAVGGRFLPSPPAAGPRLRGSASRFHLDEAQFQEFLDGTAVPVFLDGTFRWSDEVDDLDASVQPGD